MKTFIAKGHNVVPLIRTKMQSKKVSKKVRKIHAVSLNQAIRENIRRDIKKGRRLKR